MPLGRAKDRIRTVGVTTTPYVVRAPGVQLPTVWELAWLLYSPGSIPAADQTIDLYGDGATKGYKLEYLTTQAFKLTVYTAAAVSVTTANSIAGESQVFLVVYARSTGAAVSVRLNDGALVSAAAAMVAPVATSDRILGAADTGGTGILADLEMAQATLGQGHSLISTFLPTQRAQRLIEASGAVSYIDFGRSHRKTEGHFGDDVTGARIEQVGTLDSLHQRRSDRAVDWSVA